MPIIETPMTAQDEAVEVNRSTRSTFNVTLADGRNWTRPARSRSTTRASGTSRFLLYKDGDASSPRSPKSVLCGCDAAVLTL